MEQRGRNRWQTFGSLNAGKWLELATTVATSCHQLPFGSHGKEGVSGSSPEEGLNKVPISLVTSDSAVTPKPVPWSLEA